MTTKLRAASFQDNAVTTAKIAADAITTDKLYTPNLGRRNLIINGAMQVFQRGTSFTSVSNTAYHADRFELYMQNEASVYTVTQDSDAPNGFANSLKLDVTTADTSTASNEEVKLFHKLEGQDLQQFKKGTSDAEQMTLSFYVKTNKTGVYCVELYDRDNNRDVSASYTVSDTGWNRYVITFPADTTGAFDDDNASSLEITFWLIAGSAVQGGTLNTSWRSVADSSSATGQVNFADSTDNNWAITGVQLEVGDQATPFEHRSFAEELALCQRYYQVVPKYTFFTGAVEVGSASLRAGVPLARPLRASPSIGNITLVIYDDDDTPFSNAAHAIFANSGSPEVDGTTGYLSVIFSGNLSGRTDNHNVTALYGTNGTLDSEL